MNVYNESKTSILKETFEKSFEKTRFKKFIINFFNSVDLIEQTYDVADKNYHVERYTHLANYNSGIRERVAIFCIQLKVGRDIERTRTAQRNFAADILRSSGGRYDTAIVAFYIEGEAKWRLSFVKLDYEYIAGKEKEYVTPAKRYSYLVGRGEPCHTAEDRLLPIFLEENFNPTIEKIEEAFSVERVTDKFFEEYESKYKELYSYLEHDCDVFQKEAERCDISTEQFAKKLLGQLSFLYFLQKKGWLGVKVVPSPDEIISQQVYNNALYKLKQISKSILPRVFDPVENGYQLNYNKLQVLDNEEADNLCKSFAVPAISAREKKQRWGDGSKVFIRKLFHRCKKEEGNFFDDYLEPLFYEALNDESRGEMFYYKRFNCRIPFLNGGLFKPLNGYNWKYEKFQIPNTFFSNDTQTGILDVFDRYNFTMCEDEPLEKEVAVDPEMLGKIFENLLNLNDRKSKGAFYTPREIVHYMCRETLVNYIEDKIGIGDNIVKDFIMFGEHVRVANKSFDIQIRTNALKIDTALADIKIADPAVGSGAFPLGMLSEIVKVRQMLTPLIIENKYPITRDMTDFQIQQLRRFRAKEYEKRNSYDLKLQTIQNSIFAVDIDASAVDIAKLRLWLSLVVDENLDPTVEEQQDGKVTQNNPKPLPNLDYNIMCGNSLAEEFEGVKLFEYMKSVNEDNQISMDPLIIGLNEQLEELENLQRKYFSAQHEKKKKKLFNDIETCIDNIIRTKLISTNNLKALEKYELSIKEKTKPYFLWKLYFNKVFKEQGGFDIVIGNPPYGAKFSTKEKKYLVDKYPNVPDYESADYFVYKGTEILRKKGVLAYIIPNTILANMYASNMRKELLDRWNVATIDNLSDLEVFKTAKVRTCILKLINDYQENMTIEFINGNIKDGTYFQNKSIEVDKEFLKSNNSNWLNVFYQDKTIISLINKIKEGTLALGDMCKISQGLIPYDKYRGHSEEIIKNRIWHSDYCKDSTYRKELQGKDVTRYGVEWNGATWISYGDWLAAPRRPEFFNGERILIREITNPRVLAAITDHEYYNTPSIINLINFNNISCKYILGVLNSKLMSYYHCNTSPKAKKGLFPKILVNDVRNLPIYLGSEDSQARLIKLVDSLMNAKKRNDDKEVAELDLEIDNLIYKVYELSKTEINLVEEYFKK